MQFYFILGNVKRCAFISHSSAIYLTPLHDPGLPPLRGSLRCSVGQAAAELALRAQTVLADYP